MTKALFYSYLVLILLAVLQAIFYYPQLPETVASHFDGNGRPNGWSSKQTFFLTYYGLLLLMLGTLGGLPLLLRYVPVSLINVPHRKYWLAPERKEQSLSILRSKMGELGVVTLLFLISTLQLVINANLHPSKYFSSSTMWILLGGYMIYLVGWILTFMRKFRVDA